MKSVLILSLLVLMVFPMFSLEMGLEIMPDKLMEAMPMAQPNGIVKDEGELPGTGAESEALPTKVDLSEYLPSIGNQGNIGSCSAWSTIYYCKTMQENMERSWGADKSDEIFSPLFTYNQITKGVNKGTCITDHMAIVVNQGCPTLATYPDLYNLNATPSAAATQEAGKYRADSYRGLWGANNTLESVKTVLASGYPAVIGFKVYESFYTYKGGIFSSYSGAYRGGHAMCVVGYDDSLRALKIVNSWTSNWGDKGFLYLSYDLYAELATGGGVLYDHSENNTSKAFPPNDVRATQGTHLDKVAVTWTAVENTKEYIVYKSNNKEGILQEVTRVKEPRFEDSPLPGGVNYIYAVSSVNSKGMKSEMSSICEGWTGTNKKNDLPGIPGNFDFFYNGKVALFFWDEVDNAASYTLYRWNPAKGFWNEYGKTKDGYFLDKQINDDAGIPVAYYIVSAFNANGESYASNFVSVNLQAPSINSAAPPLSKISSKDDTYIKKNLAKEFKGKFYSADYFDYELMMQKFKEFYQAEMKAFENYKQKEKDEFEEWKKTQGGYR